MPRPAPYVPTKDADLDSWLANFATLTTATPSAFGLAPGDAANIAAAVASFHSAYLVTTSPSTKTAAAVSAKDTAKVSCLAIVRPYAISISLNAGVTSDNKIAVGVNPRTSTPSPIAAPTTNPVLTIDSAPPLAVILRYRDSVASPSVKSKPYGVTSVEVYCTVSPTPISDPSALLHVGGMTKSPFQIPFGSGDVGHQAYIAARYSTQKGLFGPWSPIINFTVAGSK
jgi:hypothetical protein